VTTEQEIHGTGIVPCPCVAQIHVAGHVGGRTLRRAQRPRSAQRTSAPVERTTTRYRDRPRAGDRAAAQRQRADGHGRIDRRRTRTLGDRLARCADRATTGIQCGGPKNYCAATDVVGIRVEHHAELAATRRDVCIQVDVVVGVEGQRAVACGDLVDRGGQRDVAVALAIAGNAAGRNRDVAIGKRCRNVAGEDDAGTAGRETVVAGIVGIGKCGTAGRTGADGDVVGVEQPFAPARIDPDTLNAEFAGRGIDEAAAAFAAVAACADLAACLQIAADPSVLANDSGNAAARRTVSADS